MRILFLDHPQFTSGSFFLWHGLNEVLPGAVVAYPHIPTHYDADQFDMRAQPWFVDMEALVARKELPPGIPPFALGEGLTGGGQTETKRYGMSKKFTWPSEILGESQIVQQLEAGLFDLVILANSHRVPTIALGRLKERVRSMPPIVYYDAGERDELNEHWIHVFRPSLVFKQILTPEVLNRGLTAKIQGYSLRMLPLPLSSPIVDQRDMMLEKLPWSFTRSTDEPHYKMFDIYYTMGDTWPARKPLLGMLDSFCRTRNIIALGWMTTENYHIAISRSRMAVTMRGSGRDTQRYWEIPLYETLMLADGTMGCIHPYPFEDGKTASFYGSLDDLMHKLERYLPKGGSGEAERRTISMAGKEHLRRYHSTAARSVFFLDRVREHLGVSPSPDQESSLSRWKEEHGWSPSWQGPVADARIP